MTALPSQHVQPLVSGPYRLGSVTLAVTSMSTSVVPVCLNAQQNVRGLSRLGTVTPVVASTRTYVGSVCPHLHPTNHHVQANVPRPLPLDSVTPVVISLLIFVVPVFQLVPESVRMPSGQETVTQVVMPTLTFVENVSPSTQHQPQPQQLFVCVLGSVRRQLPLETVIQAVAR